MRASERPADARRTYGYHRFQVLAALVNGLGLIAIVIVILLEAGRRLLRPAEPIMGMPMMIVAVLGLIADLAAFRILHRGDQRAVRATKQVLRDAYGITHSTIEVDASGCADDDPEPARADLHERPEPSRADRDERPPQSLGSPASSSDKIM